MYFNIRELSQDLESLLETAKHEIAVLAQK